MKVKQRLDRAGERTVIRVATDVSQTKRQDSSRGKRIRRKAEGKREETERKGRKKKMEKGQSACGA